MNRFIEEKGVDEDKWDLVFVDSINQCYKEASKTPRDSGSNHDSPFIGLTPPQCHQLLERLNEDTHSSLIFDIFAIMDERSEQDGTVLLVCAQAESDDSEENETLAYPTVRATFKASALALMLYFSGHSSVQEDAECAALEADNVYRGSHSSIQ